MRKGKKDEIKGAPEKEYIAVVRFFFCRVLIIKRVDRVSALV